jgi:hypothetical protein
VNSIVFSKNLYKYYQIITVCLELAEIMIVSFPESGIIKLRLHCAAACVPAGWTDSAGQ